MEVKSCGMWGVFKCFVTNEILLITILITLKFDLNFDSIMMEFSKYLLALHHSRICPWKHFEVYRSISISLFLVDSSSLLLRALLRILIHMEIILFQKLRKRQICVQISTCAILKMQLKFQGSCLKFLVNFPFSC